MRVLVTGGNGFVGRHAVRVLAERGHDPIVASRPSAGPVDLPMDLAEPANLRGVIEAATPDAVLHLAGQASVRESARDALATYDVNAVGTARLLDAILTATGRPIHFVLASSGEVYGRKPARAYPLDEAQAPEPDSVYAASKLAAEAFARAAASDRLALTIARPFNHIGPGQDPRFVVPAFARQIAAIAAGTAADAKLWVGNLKPQRDFLDVRDVALAYALLIEGRLEGVFNICSGQPTAIVDILRTLVTFARTGVEIRESPELFRATDHPIAFGSNAKLMAATGWTQARTLAQSLRDVYDEAFASAKSGVA